MENNECHLLIRTHLSLIFFFVVTLCLFFTFKLFFNKKVLILFVIQKSPIQLLAVSVFYKFLSEDLIALLWLENLSTDETREHCALPSYNKRWKYLNFVWNYRTWSLDNLRVCIHQILHYESDSSSSAFVSSIPEIFIWKKYLWR